MDQSSGLAMFAEGVNRLKSDCDLIEMTGTMSKVELSSSLLIRHAMAPDHRCLGSRMSCKYHLLPVLFF